VRESEYSTFETPCESGKLDGLEPFTVRFRVLCLRGGRPFFGSGEAYPDARIPIGKWYVCVCRV
jgi:hypothetical protein